MQLLESEAALVPTHTTRRASACDCAARLVINGHKDYQLQHLFSTLINQLKSLLSAPQVGAVARNVITAPTKTNIWPVSMAAWPFPAPALIASRALYPLLSQHHMLSGYFLRSSGTCIWRRPVQHSLTIEITTGGRIKNSVRGESARDRRRVGRGSQVTHLGGKLNGEQTKEDRVC